MFQTQRNVRVYNLLKQELSKKLMASCKWISSIDIHPKGNIFCKKIFLLALLTFIKMYDRAESFFNRIVFNVCIFIDYDLHHKSDIQSICNIFQGTKNKHNSTINRGCDKHDIKLWCIKKEYL